MSTPNSHSRIAIGVSLLGVLLTATALCAAPAASAHPGHHGPGGPGGFGGGGRLMASLAQLDLNPDQKEQIKKVLADTQPAMEPLVDASFAAKNDLFQAIHAAGSDPKAVRKAAEKAGQAGADLAVARARMFSQVRAVLTPDQNKTLDDQMERTLSRMESRRQLGQTIWREHAADFVDAL